ncbi:Putative accessory processing protein; involved in the adherence of host cells [gamma proteobacterium HdN1]|nr:Putative accessory processing protein; involved in the adherence of host cells [gamma proteobacterium HdN1]
MPCRFQFHRKNTMDIMVELDLFEQLVRERNHEGAYQKLLTLIKQVSVHRGRKEEVFARLNREEISYVATRIASAAYQLFLDEKFLLSEEGYCALSLFGRNFALLVAMTPYKVSDHVIRHLIGQAHGVTRRDAVDLYTFRKMLFLWSIFSEVEIPIRDFLKAHPKLMSYVVFNSLTFNCYLDAKATERREEMLEIISEDGFPFALDDLSLFFAGPSWMYCAYAHTPKKHDIKRDINQAYRNYLIQNGYKDRALPVPRKKVKRPLLGVVIEQMTSNHAVFRCYGKALASMRERFETVAFAEKTYVDDAAVSIFDQVVYMETKETSDLRDIVSKVSKKKPDVLIYLSLGMHNATIPMANLRLAPIQILLNAHPCTSRIAAVDYVIASKGLRPTRDEFSEQLVFVPDGTFAFTPRGEASSAKEPHPKGAEKKSVETAANAGGARAFRIAIPSFSIKITSRFIALLSKLTAATKTPIEFHFFPYLTGISYIHFQETMAKRLPNSVVHKPYPYERYLEKIGECDLHMSPFPFGNTNGNIDSAKMGLPLIAMDGDGFESKIDGAMFRRMGLPEWVFAENEDRYLELALSLVEDFEKRESLAAQVRAIDLDRTFYSPGLDHVAVDTVFALYERHEALQSSGVRTVDALDLIRECGLVAHSAEDQAALPAERAVGNVH